MILFPVILYSFVWKADSLINAYSLFSKTIPIFTISLSSSISLGVILRKISVDIPISSAILKSNKSKIVSSLKTRGSITLFIPPKMEGSVRTIPLRGRAWINPIIFRRLSASLTTLLATPSSAARLFSLGIESPRPKSFFLK